MHGQDRPGVRTVGDAPQTWFTYDALGSLRVPLSAPGTPLAAYPYTHRYSSSALVP
jgi:hypothetical protein